MRAVRLDFTHARQPIAVPTQLYFVETMCAERHIKIGIAANVRARMSKMQMDCPYTLRLIKRVADSAQLEAEIHARFAEQRLGGEWFARTAELEEFIEGLDGTPYLETHTATKPGGWPQFHKFPEDAKSVRTSVTRPGIRNRPAACFAETHNEAAATL